MNDALKIIEQYSSHSLHDFSFLVVDDDELARTSLVTLLLNQWRNIHQAKDGEDAIDLICQRQFDIIILDLNMPKKSGDQVLAFIKEKKIKTTVIVISGESSINKVTEAVKLGAYDIFRKPYNYDELEHCIFNAIKKINVELEKSQIQSRLTHSEKLHRYMVDNSPDLIYLLNSEGEFSFVNDSFTKLLGYEKEELLGRHYSEFIVNEDRLKAEYLFNERRTENRNNRAIELRLKCNKQNHSKHFDATSCPIELNSMGIYSRESDDVYHAQKFQGTYGVARDISRRKKAEKLITYQAYHDMLTKLPNRAMFLDRLDLAIKQSKRSGETLIIMFLDLDRFKIINDSFGHVVGDQLLIEVASRLKAEIRNGDTLARLGGDEFMLLLPQPTSKDQAEKVAQKLIKSLQNPFYLKNKEVYINVSIGISICPDDTMDTNTLIKNADLAMYEVKTSGKNNYAFFNNQLIKAAEEKMSIESGLRKALKEDEFEIYYQPQFDCQSKQIIGVEALLRWNHPTKGMLSPNYFINHAEESRIIEKITEWMLHRVNKDLFENDDFRKSNIKLSVNLSPIDIGQKEFPENLIALIDEYQIPPERLEIEITENMFMSDINACIHKLQVLANKEVSIAIDDFGTGFSSLNYLRELPVNTVKIDYSFTSEIEDSDKGAAIVAAIVGMAQGLGINLVAEGVETDTQANYLESLGCYTMQGYLFSKPVNIKSFLQKVTLQQHNISNAI